MHSSQLSLNDYIFLGELFFEYLIVKRYRVAGFLIGFLFLLSCLLDASERFGAVRTTNANKKIISKSIIDNSNTIWSQYKSNTSNKNQCADPSCKWTQYALEKLQWKPHAICNNFNISLSDFCSLRQPLINAERSTLRIFEKIMSLSNPYDFQLSKLQNCFKKCLHSVHNYSESVDLVSQQAILLDLHQNISNLSTLLRIAARVDIMYNHFSFFSVRWKLKRNISILHIGPPVKSPLIDLSPVAFVDQIADNLRFLNSSNVMKLAIKMLNIETTLSNIWSQLSYWCNVTILHVPLNKTNLTFLNTYFNELRSRANVSILRIKTKMEVLEKLEEFLSTISVEEMRVYLLFKLHLGLNIPLAAALQVPPFSALDSKMQRPQSLMCSVATDYMLLDISSIVTDIMNPFMDNSLKTSKELANLINFTNDITGSDPRSGIVLTNDNVHIGLADYKFRSSLWSMDRILKPDTPTNYAGFFNLYHNLVSDRNNLLWKEQRNVPASVFSFKTERTAQHFKYYSYSAFLVFPYLSSIEKFIYFGMDLLADVDDVEGKKWENSIEYLELETMNTMLLKFVSNHSALKTEFSAKGYEVGVASPYLAILGRCHQKHYMSLIKAYLKDTLC